MKVSGSRFGVPVIGVTVAATLWVTFGLGSAPAAVKAHTTVRAAHAAPISIVVTAGKPSELAFQLSKFSNLAPGTYTFKVTNMGMAYHNFQICSVAITGPTTDACTGPKTAILKHGESATLTFTFKGAGVYEFLCSVPGHAAAGMKGLLGIGIKVTQPTVTTTAGTTTTTKSGGSSGGSTSGATSPCPPGITIQTAGGADADGDETGTERDDGDGCI